MITLRLTDLELGCVTVVLNITYRMVKAATDKSAKNVLAIIKKIADIQCEQGLDAELYFVSLQAEQWELVRRIVLTYNMTITSVAVSSSLLRRIAEKIQSY